MNKRDILQFIENAEKEARPIAGSQFATSNESWLAISVLQLANALRLTAGLPERDH